jgi:homocitrate synthase NifV
MGRGHRWVLGKHSRSRAVRLAYAEIMAMDLAPELAARVLPQVRRFVTRHKCAAKAPELAGFLAEIDYAGAVPLQ